MVQEGEKPCRFGAHASVIQLLALVVKGAALDGGTTQFAVTLASLLFWTCAATLLWWHDGRLARGGLFNLRWGLLPFVLIGTPLLRPMVQGREWLAPVLLPCLAVLLVMPLIYLIIRVLRMRSPLDDFWRKEDCDRPPSPLE